MSGIDCSDIGGGAGLTLLDIKVYPARLDVNGLKKSVLHPSVYRICVWLPHRLIKRKTEKETNIFWGELSVCFLRAPTEIYPLNQASIAYKTAGCYEILSSRRSAERLQQG